MPTYNDALLGQPPSLFNGKDILLNYAETGAIDVYAEPFVAGVDYTLWTFGNESARDNSMLDPALLIWDTAGQLIAHIPDGGVRTPSFEEQRRDPFWYLRGSSSFSRSRDAATSFKPSQTGTYFIGVYDQARRGGTYDLAIEAAGPGFL